MPYPIFSTESDRTKSKFLVNFRDFFYELIIITGLGFDITISNNRAESYHDLCNKDFVLAKLRYCIKWLDHIQKNKVRDQDPDFQYYQFLFGVTTQHCAICDRHEIAFISSSTAAGQKKITKSFVIKKTTSEKLITSRRNRQDKKVESIERWKCIRGWKNVSEVLMASQKDMSRLKNISDHGSVSEEQRMVLFKICNRNHVPIAAVKDHRGTGVRIHNQVFFKAAAATHFVDALMEEKNNRMFPSYDVMMDRRVR